MHSEIIKALTAKLGEGTFQTNGDLGVRLLPDGDWQPVSAHLSASEIAAADAALAQKALRARINRERDRRIAAGFTFNGKTYQSDPDSLFNISGASASALGAIMANPAAATDTKWHGGATDFYWIALDNSQSVMDAATMFAFGNAAMAHKQAHIYAASVLKSTTPIPADFTNDAYWPVV